jgi:hypothetical protein
VQHCGFVTVLTDPWTDSDRTELRRCGVIKLAVSLLGRSAEVAQNAALLLADMTDNGTW